MLLTALITRDATRNSYLKDVASESLDGVVNREDMNALAILDIGTRLH